MLSQKNNNENRQHRMKDNTKAPCKKHTYPHTNAKVFEISSNSSRYSKTEKGDRTCIFFYYYHKGDYLSNNMAGWLGFPDHPFPRRGVEGTQLIMMGS